MIEKAEIYFDGSCNNRSKRKDMNGGLAVYLDNTYSETFSSSIYFGSGGTSNIAEYLALESAVEKALYLQNKKDLKRVIFYGDSQLIVKQINGRYGVGDKLYPYYKRVKELLDKLTIPYKVIWIKRDKNKKADELSKQQNLLY